MARRLAVVVFMLGAACTPTSKTGHVCPAAGQDAVMADPGLPQSVWLQSLVHLSGKGSSPVSAIFDYGWSLLQRPAGSTVQLTGASTQTPSFTADQPGTFTAALVVNDGCQSSPEATVDITVSSQANQVPVANAGSNTSVLKGTVVYLNGSQSNDPDGDPITYAWSVVSAPSTSTATLSSTTVADPMFTPVVPGTYIFKLIVNDGTVNSAPAQVTVTVTDIAPVASAVTPLVAAFGATVALNGSASSDSDGDPITYAWSFVSKPAGSAAALTNPTTATPSFVGDVDGQYVLQLVVNDGFQNSVTPAIVNVTVFHAMHTLPYAVIDARYSRALDKLVLVSDGLPTLHIYDPIAQTEQTVSLTYSPTSVRLSADGLRAVVGHNANVSYVDLTTATVVKTFSVPIAVGDMALSSSYAYVLSGASGYDSIHNINLADGGQTTTSTGGIYGPASAQLIVDGGTSVMYVGDAFGTTARYTASAASVLSLTETASSLSVPDWQSDDGRYLFTTDGTARAVVPTATSAASDLVYSGMIGSSTASSAGVFQWLDYSTPAGKILGIWSTYYAGTSAPADTTVDFYGSVNIAGLVSSTPLPEFIVSGTAYWGHGLYGFFNKAGTHYYVILKADGTAGLTSNNYAVAVY